MSKKEWKCPNGCKMEYVRVEAKEVWYNQKGWCEIDDLDGSDTNYEDGYGTDLFRAFYCPECNQALAVNVDYI